MEVSISYHTNYREDSSAHFDSPIIPEVKLQFDNMTDAEQGAGSRYRAC